MESGIPVSDVMTRAVASTRPDAKLFDAGRIMRELHVSGLPVLGEDGRIVGVLSEKDLVRKLDLSAGISSPRGLLDLLLESAPARGPSLLDLCRHRLQNASVRDAMTSPAITIPPTMNAADAARTMYRERIHRLPVVDASDQVVGIVTRADLIAATVPASERPHRGSLHPQPKSHPRRAADPYADA